MALFDDPDTWPMDDLIGASMHMDPDTVLRAYAHGAFPMPMGGHVVGWFSPVRRGILPLDRMRVTRSLRASRRRYTTTIDQACDEVIARCGDPRRPHGWIDRDILECYGELHRRGIVHSIEVWDAAGRLCGGLYGVGLGGFFAGESMFHDAEHGRDASKVALAALVDLLTADGVGNRLLDVQWRTEHLASLGVVEVERRKYLTMLHASLALPGPDWSQAAGPGVAH